MVKVTFTTSKDNPYYATTGTDTSSKKANTTDTLSYVSQITKAKSGKKSTALLGNNGKLAMVSNRSEVEVSVWEINQHLLFDKGGRNIQWRKDNLFNKWCRENWSITCKRMKLEHFLTIHKNKLKMD